MYNIHRMIHMSSAVDINHIHANVQKSQMYKKGWISLKDIGAFSREWEN